MHTQNLICYLSTNGIILDVNDNLANTLLYNRSELIGKHIFKFIIKQYADEHRLFFTELAENSNYFLLPIQRKDGNSIFTYAKATSDILNDKKVYRIVIQQITNIEQSLEITSKLLKYEILIRRITELSSSATDIQMYVKKVLTIVGKTLEVDHTFLYKHMREQKSSYNLPQFY